MIISRRSKTSAALILILFAIGCGGAGRDAKIDEAKRIADWARPLKQPGLPNLFEVTGGLYRGAQPAIEGFSSLKSMGVKTIVNLRRGDSDAEKLEDTGVSLDGVDYIHIPTKPWDIVHQDVLNFLRLAIDPDRHPLFLHCRHGADRTGTMIAAYRVVIQGWSKDDAIREMTEGGYGFHIFWANMPDYIRGLNVEAARVALGLHPDPSDQGL